MIASWALHRLKVRPHVPNVVKADTYECGVETEGPTWVRFNFRYYLVALVFVLFDVEVILSLPLGGRAGLGGALWAGGRPDLHRRAALGLAYEWKKRALEWR